jgi:hypothetical protein
MTDFGSFAFGGVQRSYSFPFFHADKIPNSLTAVVSPNMECEQIFLQNDPDSGGNITIGDARLAETGNGFVLQPGEVTGWIPVNNLNLIWHLDAADSTLNYMIIR